MQGSRGAPKAKGSISFGCAEPEAAKRNGRGEGGQGSKLAETGFNPLDARAQKKKKAKKRKGGIESGSSDNVVLRLGEVENDAPLNDAPLPPSTLHSPDNMRFEDVQEELRQAREELAQMRRAYDALMEERRLYNSDLDGLRTSNRDLVESMQRMEADRHVQQQKLADESRRLQAQDEALNALRATNLQLVEENRCLRKDKPDEEVSTSGDDAFLTTSGLAVSGLFVKKCFSSPSRPAVSPRPGLSPAPRPLSRWASIKELCVGMKSRTNPALSSALGTTAPQDRPGEKSKSAPTFDAAVRLAVGASSKNIPPALTRAMQALDVRHKVDQQLRTLALALRSRTRRGFTSNDTNEKLRTVESTVFKNPVTPEGPKDSSAPPLSEIDPALDQLIDIFWSAAAADDEDSENEDDGELDHEAVDDILAFMQVEMDAATDRAFYRALDPDEVGWVQKDAFKSVLLRFKAEARFDTWRPIILLLCELIMELEELNTEKLAMVWSVTCAAKMGSAANATVRLELGEEGLSKTLDELGIRHSSVDLQVLMAYLDEDESGFIGFEEFVNLFPKVHEDDSHPEQQFARWQTTASMASMSSTTGATAALSDDQREQVHLQERLAWYQSVFSWIFFFYIQANLAAVPVMVSFLDPTLALDGQHMHLEYSLPLLLLDLILVAKVVLELHIPREKDGQYVYDLEEARKLYYKSGNFVGDVVALLPLEVLVGAGGGGFLLHPLFRLNKLVLVAHINRIFRENLAGIFGPKWWRIANAFYLWAALSHISACIFHAVSISAGDSNTQHVLLVTEFSALSASHRYTQAYSYSVNTLAGMSRGSGIPDGDGHMVLALLAVLTGVFVYALLLAVFASSLEYKSHQERLEMFLEDVRVVIGGDVKVKKLPPSFLQECIAFHKHVFFTTGQHTLDHEIFDELPEELQVSLAVSEGRNLVSRVPIFRSAVENTEFVYAIMQCLRTMIVPPGCRVIERGAEGDEMYFIRSGRCSVLDAGGNVVWRMQGGDFFGEIALLASVPRTATVESTTFCNLMSLSKPDFDLVLSHFPELLQHIEEQAKDRIRSMQKEAGKVAERRRDAERMERRARRLQRKRARTEPAPDAVSEASAEGESESLMNASETASLAPAFNRDSTQHRLQGATQASGMLCLSSADPSTRAQTQSTMELFNWVKSECQKSEATEKRSNSRRNSEDEPCSPAQAKLQKELDFVRAKQQSELEQNERESAGFRSLATCAMGVVRSRKLSGNKEDASPKRNASQRTRARFVKGAAMAAGSGRPDSPRPLGHGSE